MRLIEREQVNQWPGRPWQARWRSSLGAFLLLISLLVAPLAPVGAAVPAPDPIIFGFAVESGNARAVRDWLDAGLDPDYQGSQIGTGLMIAAWSGNLELMELFVSRGADINRSNRHGEQALQLAAWGGHKAAVEWLLARGARVNRDQPQWSALHYAVFNGQEDIAQALLRAGANVNATSANGTTPLMLAARENKEELVPQLLEAGADPRPKNDWGDDALAIAMKFERFRIGKMIASKEVFAEAVKAPRPPPPPRSEPAPSAIDQALRQLRLAEAEGRPTEALRRELMAAIEQFKREGAPAAKATARNRASTPSALVVTARRGSPGQEKAEVVYAAPPAEAAANPAKPAPANAASSGSSASAANTGKAAAPRPGAMATTAATAGPSIGDLARQLRHAEANGEPTDALRQQLQAALEQLGRGR